MIIIDGYWWLRFDTRVISVAILLIYSQYHRYPGIISIETMPGGGTTDYSVAIFYDAIQKGSYTCYLKPETYLPMMYMPDAIHAAISLMDAPSEKLTVRTSYNLTAFSFTPEMITKELQKHAKELKVDYSIDPVRQSIADSWPDSIDDSQAQLDWAWKPQYSFELMVKDCYEKLRARLTSN
jgi:nucleoside-diphosphate-sugar epimerase